MRRKITVVGAGNVGATAAQEIARRDYADVVLVDIVEGLPQGKALDMNEAGPVLGLRGEDRRHERLRGDGRVGRRRHHVGQAALSGHEPRRPRDDEPGHRRLRHEAGGPRLAGRDRHRRDEPARRDVPRRQDTSRGCRKERVFGMAGILDTARFRTFIAWETGMSDRDVQTIVLGGHGDQMVPVVSATTVGGVPLTQLVSDASASTAMVERTRKGGGEVVNLLGTSAWYAPGAAVAADGRVDRARPEAGAPVHGAARGRVRHRRPLHGRPGRARLGRCRAGRRARAVGETSEPSSTAPPRPCARSSRFSR